MGLDFQLVFRDTVFSENALLSEAIPDFVSHSPQFLAAWKFCHTWLSNQESFELQTSGSTGAPKRIIYRRGQIEASVESTGQFLGYQLGEKSLLCLNSAFVGGIMVLARAMVYGFEVTVLEPSADSVSSLTIDHDYDHVSISPLQLRNALAHGPDPLSRFKTILVGGADLEQSLIKASIQIKGPRIYQTFGMTETLSHFALRSLNAAEPESYYTLLPGVQINTNSDSELIVNWPRVTDGPIQTHDLIDLISPTQFVWKGRTDFTINSGGIKIQPEGVEAVAKQILTAISTQTPDLVLVGLADETFGRKAVLVVEGDPIPEDQILILMEMLKATLPKYHAPKAIYFLPIFSRTPTGKPNRMAILKDQERAL